MSDLKVWRPKDSEFDYTTNAAFILAKKLNIPPLEAAKLLVAYLNEEMGTPDAVADQRV